MSILSTARDRIARCRAICGDSIAVALSGGKDSLVILDLCCEQFKRVEAFHMYLVRGLSCVETPVNKAASRHNVNVHYVPHWDLSRMFKHSVLRDPVEGADKLRILSQRDVERTITAKTGIHLFAYGERASDSFIRRFYTRENDGIRVREHRSKLYPIWDWLDDDVYAYLKVKKIPMPPKFGVVGKKSTGFSLVPETLQWMRDKYPDDFSKVLEIFPYAETVIIGNEADKNAKIQNGTSCQNDDTGSAL